jgi:maleylacetoacetate isomerase
MDMYGFWRSQATFRVRVALNLKGLSYHEIPIDLDAGGQDTPDFREVNPMGSVPALMIGAAPLTQSLAILEYLEETTPDPALLPADALGRARVRSLAAIAVSDTHPLIVPRVKKYLAAEAGFDAARWKAWQTLFCTEGLRGFEARLARDAETGSFCHGEQPTFADICLCGLMASVKTFQIATGGVPTVERIVAHCMDLPAFEQARALHQADYPTA